jgi:hypothetical protein
MIGSWAQAIQRVASCPKFATSSRRTPFDPGARVTRRGPRLLRICIRRTLTSWRSAQPKRNARVCTGSRLTTLTQLANRLPNGLHDMYIEKLVLDFERRIATFQVEVWVGDQSSDVEGEREAMRGGELILEGLLYCVLEPPDPSYPFAKPEALWSVDLCEPNPEMPLVKGLTPNAFAGRFFVSQWNAFINVAATDAILRWSGPEPMTEQ